MRVKELAELAETTVRTIRYYHHIDLLPVPEGQGFREYGFDHLVRLFRIRFLVEAGMSLDQVKEIVTGNAVNIEQELEETEQLITAQIRDLKEKRQRLSAMRSFYAAAGEPNLERLVPLPPEVDEYYDVMLSRAPTPDVEEIIKRERQTVELLCTWNLFPGLIENWTGDLTETRIKNALTLYDSFAFIHQLNEENAEEVIDQVLDEHLKLIVGDPIIDPDWIPTMMQLFSQSPQAKALLAAAFPHPMERLYVERALFRFNHVLESTSDVSRETSPATP